MYYTRYYFVVILLIIPINFTVYFYEIFVKKNRSEMDLIFFVKCITKTAK